MKQINIKKAVLLNGPYVLIGLFATKLGQAYRFSVGSDFSEKFLNITDGVTAAFQSYAPSRHVNDLVFGIVCGALVRLAVYMKSKNAKKYRKDVEYGSARWGA